MQISFLHDDTTAYVNVSLSNGEHKTDIIFTSSKYDVQWLRKLVKFLLDVAENLSNPKSSDSHLNMIIKLSPDNDDSVNSHIRYNSSLDGKNIYFLNSFALHNGKINECTSSIRINNSNSYSIVNQFIFVSNLINEYITMLVEDIDSDTPLSNMFGLEPLPMVRETAIDYMRTPVRENHHITTPGAPVANRHEYSGEGTPIYMPQFVLDQVTPQKNVLRRKEVPGAPYVNRKRSLNEFNDGEW